MWFDVFVGCLAFLAGLYVDGVRQFANSVVEWVNGVDDTVKDYEIKIEDYYDGLRDAGKTK